jgi:hypothetical protein
MLYEKYPGKVLIVDVIIENHKKWGWLPAV